MKTWTHVSIKNGKYVKQFYEQKKGEKEPRCVGSWSCDVELARKAGLK